MSLQNEEICLEETGATVLHFIVIEYNEILGREHSTGIFRMIRWGPFVGFSFCKVSSQTMYRWCCTNHAVRCKVHIRMQQRNGRKSWTTETWRIGTEMLTSYLRKLDGMLGISWDVFHHLTSPWPMVSAPWPFVNWCVSWLTWLSPLCQLAPKNNSQNFRFIPFFPLDEDLVFLFKKVSILVYVLVMFYRF